MRRIAVLIELLISCIIVAAHNPYWITANDSLVNQPNTWIEFRKHFNLKKKPKNIEALIAADSKYWLWINGMLVVFEGGLKRGPNPKDTYFDVVDLTSYLNYGDNDVKVLLCYFGKPGFSHVNSGKAGIIFDASSIGLVSDCSWQSQRVKAYQTCEMPFANFRLAESNICYDARLADQNEFKPSLEIGTWGEGVWGKMIMRPIPQWRDYGMKTAIFNRTEDDKGNVVLSVRLPYNMQITPAIDITDEKGNTVINIETDHVKGGSQDCIRAQYITRKGRQQYESLGWMNGDILRIIYPKNADINFHNIAYRETGYDCDFEGTFTCNDSIINLFWQKAMRTLYVNMRDNYFDCPDRERAQWWGDVTILMGQSFYQLSPRANALMRKAIHELVDWQKEDGTLFSPIPAENWNQELPAQMLAAIGTYGFWYYYWHTGDFETMRYVYPAMKRYLDLWGLDNDGLTQFRQGGWSWGDWGQEIDIRLLLSAWHYMALQSAVNIARLTCNDVDVKNYEVQMESIHKAFNRCWNGYAYRHPSYHGATDDRVQALAIVSGLADNMKYDKLFSVIKTQEYASPYMEKYVYEALIKIGYGDYALERFKRRFAPMIVDPLHTTLYEGWEEGGYGGGSTNHAWSGGMLTNICELIVGLKPTSPGWKTFEFAPCPIISEASITVPTLSGDISASYKVEEDLLMTLVVPPGTKAAVRLPSDDYHTIVVNEKIVDFNFLNHIGPGNYKIRSKFSAK